MRKGKRRLLALAALAGTSWMLQSGEAHAQQRAFALDRLQMPGAPDDGVVLFRPVTQPRTLFFAQLGLGYTRVPLRTNLVVPDSDRGLLSRSRRGVVENQFTFYGNVGIHLIDRLTFGAAIPITAIQSGGNPAYDSGESFKTTSVNTGGPAAGDARLDARAVLLRSKTRASALGIGAHVFLPTGSNNFGGDGSASALLQLNAETRVWYMSLVANVGFHFRPNSVINDPATESGLGVGRELRAGLGAFLPIPLSTGRFRVGATVFGQTGMEKNAIIGNTIFRKENTPLEFNLEGRVRFGPTDRMWAGAAAGSRILNGYGSPDLRVLAFVGIEAPLFEPPTKGVDPKLALREKWKREAKIDTDKDGIPDEYDACPYDKEDGIGDPNDGCPTNDRDGDGIPDKLDKCPDVPEDKDGIDDTDGCPEDDVDKDGVADAEDACPREPGKPNADKTKNGCPEFVSRDGSSLRILQQVHFATGSANILPDSFPMLQEIANILIANPGIHKMSVEGHTDNKGGAAMNKSLSQNRANSVMKWLTDHKVEKERLEAHGYGLEQPIEDNKTEAGRAKNRRVEFKITQEDAPQ